MKSVHGYFRSVIFLLNIILLSISIIILISCANEKRQKHTDTALFVPDDLEATLWASSPMFFNPTNMDVDLRGRIWITEAVNYRDFRNDSIKHLYHEGGDRVIILEDTNHDGKADK